MKSDRKEEITIRQAQTSDANSLTSLLEQLGHKTEIDHVAQRLNQITSNENNIVFVAVDKQSQVVGYIHVFILSSLLEPGAIINGLVVDAAKRNRGIGKKLLLSAENWAKSRGVNRVVVRSRQERTSAHKFYQYLGYTKLKTQYVFDKSIDCLLITLNLCPCFYFVFAVCPIAAI